MNLIKKENMYIYQNEKEEMLAYIEVNETDETLTIESVYVDESRRKTGLGKELVMYVYNLSKKENKKIISNCPFSEKILKQII